MGYLPNPFSFGHYVLSNMKALPEISKILAAFNFEQEEWTYDPNAIIHNKRVGYGIVNTYVY